ncbi:DUF4112 domain-containing protein [Aspergillus lucknowensis]|uniref:PH domain protein n=1 Tax=Aspergillus lucknowensis TaxID=176173 RepID=A0ABR4LK31_9EURO
MSFLFSLVGKKILAESARNHFGNEDPYFEEVPASRLGRAFGKKTRKRRKAIPPGLSENDTKVLTRVKRRAYRLDYCLFNLCGIRFGWGSAIGLFPLIGDAADAALAMMVLKTCEGIDGGLPARLRMQMIINILLDFVIGLVPFVGDIADAVYKCNTRNAVILENYLRNKGAKAASRQMGRRDADVDPSLPSEFDRYDSEIVENPRQGGPARTKSAKDPSQPAAANHQTKSQSRREGRSGKSKRREGDLERGNIDHSQT